MLNLIATMSMAANSEFTDNTTFYYIKRVGLVHLSGMVIVQHVQQQLAGRSGLLSSSSSPLKFPGIGPPTVLADKSVVRRDDAARRLPCERTDAFMLYASAQHRSNNVSASWNRRKQLCPLNLGLLQRGTSHVEHIHVVLLPRRVWCLSPLE